MLSTERHREAAGVFAAAYLVGPVTDRMWSRSVASYAASTVHGILDADDRVAAVARWFPQRLAVPGGSIDSAGITSVGVRLDQRRRGHLGALVRAQLTSIRDAGIPVATLRATEGGIYARYGYGVASSYATISLDRRRAQLRPEAATSRTLRALPPTEALQILPGLHERVRGTRPGTVDRPLWWWTSVVSTYLDKDEPLWVLCTVDDRGVLDGAVIYTTQDRALWEREPGRAALQVLDLVGDGPGVELALWQGLLAVDLTETIIATGRPTNDVLTLALTDPRAARVSAVEDETWLRLLDVPAALAARSWGAGPDAVVLEVTDRLFADNAGRYRISTAGAARTEAAAEVRLDVSELSSAYLGGTTLTALAAAGRVHGAAGGLARADALFGVGARPWCGTYF